MAEAAAGIVLAGNSVMLVEDEAIVAIAVGDSLADLGLSVVGPFSRVADACRASSSQLRFVQSGVTSGSTIFTGATFEKSSMSP